MATLKGARLLRVKGIVNVAGSPVAVHVVQSVIHEPVALEAWPSADRSTRIVFITRGMERGEIEATLPALGLDAKPRTAGAAIDPAAYARFARVAAAFGGGRQRPPHHPHPNLPPEGEGQTSGATET
jgi:hypothetical protein